MNVYMSVCVCKIKKLIHYIPNLLFHIYNVLLLYVLVSIKCLISVYFSIFNKSTTFPTTRNMPKNAITYIK